ncbi:MAG: PAS domain S-box protein [candidate division KSB1 bacterium]|nr:PAS domain S-box protein [candidate division KSB1 bacterium]MDZ7368078.1 PAS domain S-box protein [candidate division KSB1 bacterium]MDZ7405696.1 PAS domain S-box protein [candidate division KSB1 bacterium]
MSTSAQNSLHLEKKLNWLYSAFQHSTDAILFTDLNGYIIEANRAFTELFGWTHEEIIGKSTRILRSSKTTNEFYKHMWETINQTGSWKGEIVNRRKDGSEVPVLLSITPVYSNEEKIGYMGVEIDISEKKNFEKTERWAAIGKMAAKVAHEIRNPLSSISLNAELLQDEISNYFAVDTKEAMTLLKAISAEIDRVTSLTEEYLQFSRLPESRPVRGNLYHVLEELIEFISNELEHKKIEFEYCIQDNLPLLYFDRVQIRRALLNIIRNAIEAMPKGGKLKLWTEQTNQKVVIQVADTGSGISDDVIEKIFDPFFTTKDFGTGLGLAVVQQIIDEHGGQISCRSRVGEGTTFSITLFLDETEGDKQDADKIDPDRG